MIVCLFLETNSHLDPYVSKLEKVIQSNSRPSYLRGPSEVLPHLFIGQLEI